MVSEPLLWLFLGSPVFINIILDSQLLPPLQLLLQSFAVKPLTCFRHRLWFRTCSRCQLESRDHCQTIAAVILAPIVFLQVPLRSSSADLPSRGNLTIIGAPTRPHALPKESAQQLTHSLRRHAPPGSVMRFHTPSLFVMRLHAPGFLLLTSTLGDVISVTSSADVTCQLADIIVDQDVD